MRLHATHPAVVASTVLALSIGGATLYAGPHVSLAFVTLTQSAILLILWLAAAVGWGAFPVRWATRGADTSPLLAGVTAAAVGIGAMGLAVLLGGLAGMVAGWFAWSVLAGGWVAGLAYYALHRPKNTSAPTAPDATLDDVKPQGRRSRGRKPAGSRPQPLSYSSLTPATPDRAALWRWFWLLVVPAVSVVLVSSVVPAGWLWKPDEPHGFDVVEYHFQVPREWLEAGRIEPLRHNAFSFFPFGVEMHYLLAMQLQGGAWAGAYLAQLMHATMTALAAAAACGFAGKLSGSKWAAIIASVAGATTPWLMQLAPIGFNEGGLLLFGTLAAGWALLALGVSVEPRPLRLHALAGAMAGFACGVKLTAGPLVLAAVPVMLLVAAGRHRFRRALAGAAVYAAVGTAVFAPWPIRNVAWCGNPVFPEASAVFGPGHFTDAQVQRWKAAHAPRPDQQPIGARLAAFGREVIGSWQFGFVLLPLAVVGLALTFRDRRAWFLAGLLFLHAVFWVGFTHLQSRFFVLGVPLAVLAIATARWDVLPVRPIAVATVLAVIVAAAALGGWWNVHRRLAFKLHHEGGNGIAQALGNDDLSWITSIAIERFPAADPNATLQLAGDAQAFWYPLPMSRLSYRTPFDVPGGPADDARAGYAGPDPSPGTWTLVSPDELRRFGRTYQPFPPAPADWQREPWWAKPDPVLLPPRPPDRP